jgi:hypothetical protein
MPAIKNCAVIVSDFPDDAVESEDGKEILVFPGRNLSEAFCEILSGLGYSTTVPEHEHEHGWTFVATSEDGCRTWFQVTIINECVVVTEDQGRRRYAGPTAPAYLDLLSKFATALEADDRFGEVRWSTSDDVRFRSDEAGPSLLEPRPFNASHASATSPYGDSPASGVRCATGGLGGTNTAARTCAVFTVDMPDNGPFTLEATIARAFCEILGDLGQKTTRPYGRGDGSTTFTATAANGCRVGFQLFSKSDYRLSTQNYGRGRGLFGLYSKRRRAADAASYADLLAKFAAELERYPRFKSVCWCTEAELGA